MARRQRERHPDYPTGHRPRDAARTFTYESTFSNVTSAVDPLGNTTTFEYDGTGNLIAITDPEQNLQLEGQRLKTHLTYNQYGQPITVTDPLGNPTTFTYTDAGDLATGPIPWGHHHPSYDAISRLASQTDPLGRFTWFTYDAMNRLASTGDPLLGVTSFTYDPNGNLLTVQDAQGHTTSHEYDNRDRLSRR